MKIKDPKYKFKNVLLIDDSELDNFINEKMIESTHFSKNINVSTNGQAGLDFVEGFVNSNVDHEESNLDCMFVDLNMPLMGGFEFITRFKMLTNQRLQKCKIIILTSSIAQEDRIKAVKMDPEIIFINKPLTTHFLNSL